MKKLKKIVAAVAAAAVAVSMTMVNAFAATVQMDSEYPGAWGASKTIPKAEFEAIGGDVKVVLTLEVKEPLVGEHNQLCKPMNICVSWDQITDQLTSDTAIAKNDGFFVIADGQTSLEFVVPESVWQSFKGYVDADGNEDESAGLAFQVNDVIIKSAELSAADGAEAEIKRVTEAQSKDIMDGKSYEEATGAAADDTASAEADTEEDAAPAQEEASTEDTAAPAAEADTADTAPAADSSTTSAGTGNAPVAVMVSVMAVAGVAAAVSRKRK